MSLSLATALAVSLSLRVTSIYQTNAAAAVDMLVWCAVRAASMKSAEFLVCISTAWVKCGSVAEWLAYWTQAQKGPGSNRSRDAVG